ncbi:MAG: hypothetical protein ACI9G1_003824 [Pirellulaceae bacterium]|jgi:hypothetical protein
MNKWQILALFGKSTVFPAVKAIYEVAVQCIFIGAVAAIVAAIVFVVVPIIISVASRSRKSRRRDDSPFVASRSDTLL